MRPDIERGLFGGNGDDFTIKRDLVLSFVAPGQTRCRLISYGHGMEQKGFRHRPPLSALTGTVSPPAAQYLSIRYTERLSEAGAVASVGSKGDSYDNALAETIIGLYKTEVIRRRGPWKNIEDVEFATLEGSTGSTTGASSNRSATSCRPNTKCSTGPGPAERIQSDSQS